MPSNTVEYQKAYYEHNKERIINQLRINSNIEVKCEICNKCIKKSNLTAHNKTKMHLFIKDYRPTL